MNRPIVCSILVYITVYWWCITRPSYSHYEHIYIHITCGPVPFLKPLLGRNGRAAASCQVDHWDDSAAAGCPLMFQPTPGSNGSGTSESKNWKRWGWEEGTMGTGNGAWVWVIPCYTMLYHVIHRINLEWQYLPIVLCCRFSIVGCWEVSRL